MYSADDGAGLPKGLQVCGRNPQSPVVSEHAWITHSTEGQKLPPVEQQCQSLGETLNPLRIRDVKKFVPLKLKIIIERTDIIHTL